MTRLYIGWELEYNTLRMKINVKHIAKLANLTISDDEVTKFESQLSQILTHIEKLNEVDTTNIKPTSQVTGLENILRDDNVIPSLSQDNALSNAKSQHNNLITVKGILEE